MVMDEIGIRGRWISRMAGWDGDGMEPEGPDGMGEYISYISLPTTPG